MVTESLDGKNGKKINPSGNSTVPAQGHRAK